MSSWDCWVDRIAQIKTKKSNMQPVKIISCLKCCINKIVSFSSFFFFGCLGEGGWLNFSLNQIREKKYIYLNHCMVIWIINHNNHVTYFYSHIVFFFFFVRKSYSLFRGLNKLHDKKIYVNSSIKYISIITK